MNHALRHPPCEPFTIQSKREKRCRDIPTKRNFETFEALGASPVRPQLTLKNVHQDTCFYSFVLGGGGYIRQTKDYCKDGKQTWLIWYGGGKNFIRSSWVVYKAIERPHIYGGRGMPSTPRTPHS